MKKNIIKILSLAGLIFSIAPIVLAVTNYGLGDELNPVIDRIRIILQAVGFVIAAFCIVYGGVQIIMAGGSTEKVEGGKRMILYAVGGLVIMLIGWSIAKIACYIGTGNWTC
jgi:hypothetical protein